MVKWQRKSKGAGPFFSTVLAERDKRRERRRGRLRLGRGLRFRRRAMSPTLTPDLSLNPPPNLNLHLTPSPLLSRSARSLVFSRNLVNMRSVRRKDPSQTTEDIL